ncbi:C40 family peptidase [Pontibacter indicus]|uniref:Lipoprotein Spr/probable lipoprotein NlpC n=1 Tax=Pontibacter indicus TaxID=1317125 RepID=A0A1R3XGA2_9BACT|nr:NlpC/P60 family protein [Pontibacter indicus]SIT90319.1 lipoprotein Spr/probable lipoprotein NlpC [Pontibacter indicus]
MTKTIILSVLALISIALSFFYDVKKPEATPAETEAANLTLYPVQTGEDIARALALTVPLDLSEPVDSAFYKRYSRKLGLQLDYNEDKTLLETVTKWLGTPYSYGSSSKRGTDCSGFVTRIYSDVYGIDLSRSSRSMFDDVTRIRKDSVRTGDLVFFRRGPRQPIFHVGIYLKDNKFVHSATSGGVMVSSLKEPYYRNYYYAAGRVD